MAGAQFARMLRDDEIVARTLVWGGEIVGPVSAASTNFLALANIPSVLEVLTPPHQMAVIPFVWNGQNLVATRFYIRVLDAPLGMRLTSLFVRQRLGLAAFNSGLAPIAANVYALTDQVEANGAIGGTVAGQNVPTAAPDESFLARVTEGIRGGAQLIGDAAERGAQVAEQGASTLKFLSFVPLYLAILGVVGLVGYWLLTRKSG